MHYDPNGECLVYYSATSNLWTSTAIDKCDLGETIDVLNKIMRSSLENDGVEKIKFF